MKSFKKLLCMISLTAMMLSLSACMSMENGLIINKDGTVRLYCDATIDESALSQMDMTREEFIESINESEDASDYEGFTTESVETQIDGKKYIGQRYYKDMKLDELNNHKQASDSDSEVDVTYNAVKKGNKLTITITYKNVAPAADNSSDIEGEELGNYIAQGMMTTKQCITCPYKIVETNGVQDTSTNKVTWNTLSVFTGEENEMVCTVTYKLPIPLWLIIGIIAVVVAIVVVVVIIIVKKKNKVETYNFYSNPPEDYNDEI